MAGSWWDKALDALAYGSAQQAKPMNPAEEAGLLLHLEEKSNAYRNIWRECVEAPDCWTVHDTFDVTLVFRECAKEYLPSTAVNKRWCYVFLANRDDSFEADKLTHFIHGNGGRNRTPRDVDLTYYVGGSRAHQDGQEQTCRCASPAEAVRTLLVRARERFAVTPAGADGRATT